MFHYDPSDELCPTYLQREDIQYNIGYVNKNRNNYYGDTFSKKTNATSA